MKKLTALFMALVMMMAMATTASAVQFTIDGATTEKDYKAYKVLKVEGTKDAIRYKADDDWASFINDYAALEKSADGYVSEGTGFTAAAFAADVINAGIGPDVTSNTGKIDLDNGYWVMFSPLGTPFVFTVIEDEISTGGTTIKEKTGLPQIAKTVDKTTACIGDTLTYTVTVTAAKGNDTYTITDKVPTGITIEEIKSVTGAGSAVATLTGDTISLTVSGTNRSDLVDHSEIVITYTAKLNKNATIADVGNKNTATLTYGDASGLSKTASATVHTYQLTVNKTDGSSALEGAKFKLKNSDDKFALVTEGYISGWDANGTVLTTPVSGVIKFIGLGGDTTYTVVETAPPAGYIKAADKTVTFTAKDEVVTIVNTPGELLPETGGMGTTVFYLSGAVLMMAAGVLMLSKKRRFA